MKYGTSMNMYHIIRWKQNAFVRDVEKIQIVDGGALDIWRQKVDPWKSTKM